VGGRLSSSFYGQALVIGNKAFGMEGVESEGQLKGLNDDSPG
jgi:hypothetical protein